MRETTENWTQVTERLVEFGTTYSLQIVGAVIILGVGLLLGRWAAKIVLRIAERRELDVTLSRFIAAALRLSIVGFALIAALGKFGIAITPFVAAIGAAAFGVSFAIQGPVANYGAGLLILLMRPFVVGDTIAVAGATGLVDDVKLGATTLVDEDGVRTVIPNKFVVGQILSNSAAYRIVEGELGIGYDSDPETAVGVLREALWTIGDIPEKPAPQVGIQSFGDSAIVLGYRFWVPTTKYVQTMYAANMAVHKAITKAGVNIPFPQREVRMLPVADEVSAA